ncbi:uncharacterized protein ATNIH1004_007276 [Aspergillus tanneri]|uniref:Uncharacterized protein n=1 Tax=Aspergillus tanneri TaxID=1220188 RepID=A0A5M9MFV5_9EURO|nr:uncharacterized protein ATNIH1004_007276 [Aspergillus tanneri]KAA8645855.1 hypothetical protein ATNIH1004_007276 [Aspergillus tanneri]
MSDLSDLSDESVNESYPDGSILRGREGFEIEFLSFRFRLETLIWKRPDSGLNERVGLFRAEELSISIRMKFMVQLKIECASSQPSSIFLHLFRYETDVFDNLTESGYTPGFITRAFLIQDDTYAYPGGCLHVYVLDDYPLLDLYDACRFLIKEDLYPLEKHFYNMQKYFDKYGIVSRGYMTMYKFHVEKKA